MGVIYFAKFIALVQLVIHVRYVVFVTLYIRRDSCSLLNAKVGCCLFYPRCTGFTPDVYLIALF